MKIKTKLIFTGFKELSTKTITNPNNEHKIVIILSSLKRALTLGVKGEKEILND